jgi:ketosteroid isomerase-like protein
VSENVQTIRGIYEAFGRGDIPAILERFDPDIEMEWETMDHGVPWLKHRRGRGGAGEFFGQLAGLEFRRFEPIALLSDQEHVAAVIRENVLVKSTGKSIVDVAIHLWTFGPNGKVIRLRHFVDTQQHLAASQQ